ncbi:MAG: DUF6612 family protein [Acetivibrionales bacterium]
MKVKTLLLTLFLTIFLSTGSVFAAETVQAPNPVEVPDIRIVMDGRLERFEKVPVSVNNSTMLPFRELLVKLGVPNDDGHIIYNHDKKSVTVWYGQTKIYLLIGQNEAFVNDEPISLNAAPILYKGSTYVPLRFLAETMGKKVIWDGETRTVRICDAEKYENVKKILDKSAEESAKVKKMKMDINMTGDLKSGDTNFDIALDVSSLVDTLNKRMHIKAQAYVNELQISTEAYCADNSLYILNPLLGSWSEMIFTDMEYSMMFEKQDGNIVIDNNDYLYTALNQLDSKHDDEILLSGNVYLYDLIEKVFAQQGLDYAGDIGDDIEFDDLAVEISINRDTYLMNYIKIDLKITQRASGITDETAVNFSVKLASNYDEDFTITVPEDVIENAVLIEDEIAVSPIYY